MCKKSFHNWKKCIFKRTCFGCGGISQLWGPKIVLLWCSDWLKIVILWHSIACKSEIYAAQCRSLLQEEAAAEDASRAAVHVESCDTMCSRKDQCQAPPDNPETDDTYEYHSRERRSCAGQKIVPGIEHQNVHRRRSSSSSASIYIRVYTSEADFHKPEIYGGRVRVWATEWAVFHCTPSRGGRGRRAAVDIFRGMFF